MRTNSPGPRPARRLPRLLMSMAAALCALLLPLSAASPAGAATLEAHVSYIDQDGWGNTKYDVRFNGTVRPDGPTRYVINGTLDANCDDGAPTSQSVTLGYRNWNGTWMYQSFWCSVAPVTVSVNGSRHEGGSVEMVVGATSGAFNTYRYGETGFFPIGTD